MLNFLKKKYTIKLFVCKNEEEIAEKSSKIFIDQIIAKPNSVLGLATGSSPVPLYKKLIKANKEKLISFEQIKTFNLDEYIGLSHDFVDQSYRTFMNDNLFKSVNISVDNTHFPYKQDSKNYDQDIKNAGGIDLQVLGLGVNGHIAFNEPGTKLNAKTHVVKITKSTKEANARFFGGDESKVPSEAVTMGIKTILSAKKIILIATGPKKADAIAKLFANKYDPQWPCTSLIYHPDVSVFVDYQAASKIDK